MQIGIGVGSELATRFFLEQRAGEKQSETMRRLIDTVLADGELRALAMRVTLLYGRQRYGAGVRQ